MHFFSISYGSSYNFVTDFYSFPNNIYQNRWIGSQVMTNLVRDRIERLMKNVRVAGKFNLLYSLISSHLIRCWNFR